MADYDRPEDREGGARPDTSKLISVRVGNIPYDLQSDELREHFQKYGPIGDVFLPMDRRSGRGRGFGFVRFENKEDADAAIENENDKETFGRRMFVSLAHDRGARGERRGGFGGNRRGGYRGRERFGDRYGGRYDRRDRNDRYGDDRHGGRGGYRRGGYRGERRDRSRSPGYRDDHPRAPRYQDEARRERSYSRE